MNTSEDIVGSWEAQGEGSVLGTVSSHMDNGFPLKEKTEKLLKVEQEGGEALVRVFMEHPVPHTCRNELDAFGETGARQSEYQEQVRVWATMNRKGGTFK